MDASSNNPAALLIAGTVVQPATQPAPAALADSGPVATSSPDRADAGMRPPAESEFSNKMRQLEDPAGPKTPAQSQPASDHHEAPTEATATSSNDTDTTRPGPTEPAPAEAEAADAAPPVDLDLFAHGGFLPEDAGESLPENGKVLPPLTATQPTESPADNTAPATEPEPVGPPVMPVSMTPDSDGMPVPTGAETRATAATTVAPPMATGRAEAPVSTTPLVDDGPPLPATTNQTATDTQSQSGDGNARSTEQQLAALKDMLTQPGSNTTATRGIPVADLPNPATLAGTSRLGSEFSGLLSELASASDQRPLQPLADAREFAAGLNQRLSVMTHNGLQTARIQLHPEQLGPLEVRIQVEDDVAQVWFSAQHGQTREALEQALPRLRELFADQGLQLIRSDVSDGQPDSGDKAAGESNSDRGTPAKLSRDHGGAREEFLLTRRALGSLHSGHLLDLRV
ncbi:MAG: flagellar hook-length control protein FliK [Gammaproteobacteria bacterium]|nr:flagellar hook-length control protein FliK [Gammaproteobacteria bacterium]